VRALATALLALVLAVLSAVPTVFLHPLWWTWPLAVLTALAWLLALPCGWPRLLYAVGWAAVAFRFAVPRPEGDLVVAGDLAGYLLLGLGLVLVLAALATWSLCRRSRRARHPVPSGPTA